MTTICYDGKSLCTDSLVSSGDIRFGTTEKIRKLKNGGYVALSGDLGFINDVVVWRDGGQRPEGKDGESALGIYISPTGEAFEISQNLRMWKACVPWAGGSGEVIALAVIKHNGTAREAVEIACQLDKGSGLPVQEVTIGKSKSKRKQILK